MSLSLSVISESLAQPYCKYCSLSVSTVMKVWFTTNGMRVKNNTYVTWTSKNKMSMTWDLYCCVVPQCEALCHCFSAVFSTLADEFGGFGAVFGTGLKERNQTIGYKRQGGISTYRKAFLLFWRWIFKEKTEEIWSWLFFTTWFSWILNFIIRFKFVCTDQLLCHCILICSNVR